MKPHRCTSAWTAVLLSLFVGAAACDAPQKPPPADEQMCGDEPVAAPACGPAWCEEHQIAEADCRICHPDGGASTTSQKP